MTNCTSFLFMQEEEKVPHNRHGIATYTNGTKDSIELQAFDEQGCHMGVRITLTLAQTRRLANALFILCAAAQEE